MTTAVIFTPPPIKTRKNNGFTLIELSIVLVIIGLIIGGILVGQDLIKSATVRAQISQIDKYNAAVNTFYGKYGGIPGDLALTSATRFGFTIGTNCDGSAGGRDGNGLIDGYAAPDLYYQGLGETEFFWIDLSTAGYLDGAFPNNGAPMPPCHDAGYASTVTGTAVSKYLPAAKIGYGNSVYVYEFNGNNWFGLNQVVGLGNLFSAAASLPVIAAYNIDKKMDDGLPTTGEVQVLYLFDYANLDDGLSGNPDTSSTCYNSSTLQYSTSVNNGSGPNCGLSFKMISPGR